MKRGRVIIALALIAGSLGWVAFKGLTNNLVYFVTPTELLTRGTVGERVRLGGLVDPGSVQHQGPTIQFVVTDGTTRMTVVDTGGVPSLFREGQGVVVEGVYGTDGAFHADTVLVKHSDNYTPPPKGVIPTTAHVTGGG